VGNGGRIDMLGLMRAEVLEGFNDSSEGVHSTPFCVKDRMSNPSISIDEGKATMETPFISRHLGSTMRVETGDLEREM